MHSCKLLCMELQTDHKLSYNFLVTHVDVQIVARLYLNAQKCKAVKAASTTSTLALQPKWSSARALTGLRIET